MHEIIKSHPVVAILRDIPSEILPDYVTSLYEGGLRAFEVSLSTKDALSQLKWMKKNMPKDCLAGAGTVLTKENAEASLEMGADFLLSPSSNPEVLDYCAGNHIPFLPGVFSPTDVSVCKSYGFTTLKLFPARDLPPNYINDLRGPFPDTEYVAVGGVSPQNTASYLKAGFAGVGIGGSLVSRELFEAENWQQIMKSIHLFLDSLRKDELI